MFISSPAMAGEIDYFCWFGAEAAARVDAGVGAFWNGTAWDQSQVFLITAASSGGALPGNFAIIVSQKSRNAALDADNQCGLVIDRDLLVAGQAGAVVATPGVATAIRTGLHFTPVPAGSLIGNDIHGYKSTGLGQ